ncbi:bifunctional enoyl-CoA hydratase/phosphate acetyltransferase, partial [Candidatus Venteria ishoeyi]|uniref:bifunctional enoyl-CoA hydratase/phosphate acetyltransferase n=1 Tax=Candidatus Venteria ishoeyi TaxID=1899563 RepID=UPI000B241AFF
EMFDVLKSKDKKRLVAAYANDAHTIEAVNNAVDRGLIEATLVGDEATIKSVCKAENIDVSKFKIVQEDNDAKAASKAVELINNGEGDILMKGLVNTEKYMKAILNKEKGLMPPKAVLSHVTCMENPNYHKLLVFGDVAVLPAPELPEKIAILNYLVKTAQALGIETPKVAVISASESVSPKIQSSVDAAILSKMADRGQIGGAIVEGPLALDLAIDKESAEIKKMTNPVAGDADCLLFPNIETGNVFYKTNTKLANAELCAVVAGAKVPCILSSRGDSVTTKLYSIALGAMIANL